MPDAANGRVDDRRRPVVLVCLGAYWPGNDASGPNRSFAAFADALGDEFEIRLLARNAPFGARRMNASPAWVDRGAYRARYFACGPFGARGLTDAMRETPHDLLLLNGFFDRDFTIPALLARATRRLPRTPVILSPRGEFSDGALRLKSIRKAVWRLIVRSGALLRDIVVHATGETERDDIIRHAPGAKAYVIAPNLSRLSDPSSRSPSENGVLRLCFVGRISPVKNLDFALSILARVKAKVRFDIVGPASDEAYAARCRALAAALPSHIGVTWYGEMPNRDVPAVLAGADMLFLPSVSENFGHAIFEALACGTPVLIGQDTPWRELPSDRAGFDLSLAEPDAFVSVIEMYAAMSATERAAFTAGARGRAERSVARSEARLRTRTMLLEAMGRRPC